MNRIVTQALDAPGTEAGTMRKGLRLAVRGFLALAALLTVTITATSATMLYNSALALRDEAEASAVHLAELLSASFADMGEISLANVARTLDATLDDQMIAQARLAAHLVAAAEEAGQDPPRIIETLDAIVASTVLDEFWITDSVGFSYLTNVRDAAGALVPFRFDPDPTVQPQASKFYVLLGSDVDDVITQPAQVREIDQEVYKYVGVGGVDQERIVQIGNALVFGEQEILTNVYATERADVSAVVEGIVGQQMLVQATIVGHFVAAAEEAAWPAQEIEGRLRRIVGSTVIGEIRVVNPDGTVAYSTLLPPLAGGAAAGVPHAGELAPLLEGAERSVELATAPRASDGQVYKYVAVAGAGSPRVVQIGIPIEGSSGNLLYSVYQREADLLVRSRNLEALWVVNLDRELAAAAPRAGQAAAGTADAAGAFARRAEAVMGQAMEQGQVVSETSLSLLSPADRGIWVASPIINAGGIPIGGLALAVSLDDIANSVQAEARNTTLIAFVLLGFTAAAALWGTRWLTQPIEAIAAAARQVEMGRQPDEGPMETVMKRTDELGSLARVFEAMTVQVFNREEQLEMMVAARTDELQQSNRSLRLAQQALEQDLEMAKVVQAALVREGNVDLGGFAAYARMTPAQQVGGDFVDVLEPSGGKLFFTVCDVSGKGVAAALFMAASQGAINAAASESQSGDVGAIATEANRRLCAENPMGLFVTGVLAIVDLERAVMEYVCAGHEPAFLVAGDDSRRPLPMTGGVAMGVLDDFRYESRKQKLAPGEALFLYTDGLTDAVNLTGELFGKERLEATLDGASARSPEEIVDHVWSEIGTYSAGAPAADDMTCLVLRRRR
ncbi:MAG: SpoIIE family protein phosphatase [Acidobacteria bacterium]|nr:SpoIIE family protein phosphatase [Acidobacteriota bacterium]